MWVKGSSRMRPMTAQRKATTGRVMIHVDPKTGSAPRHLPTHRSDTSVRSAMGEGDSAGGGRQTGRQDRRTPPSWWRVYPTPMVHDGE